MALFQEAIIRKHLLTIDAHVLDSAYNEYKRVYSPEKIKNIRVAKEEQYQEGFIKEIFGSVLGYSVYPESPFNIETEKKNETNAKKADGAILSGEKVVGVIELKDNKTKNLDAVKDQAFGYKNNHKDCSYVISSNFHKLRFYIDDATDYEEFDLYNLDKETFKRFYLYLRKEGLLDKNLPKLLRQETKFHEEEISKKLYKDYSNFKRRFFENAVQNNPQHDKLELFKKSQKFLDRILFLLFAEDKGLVGTNSIVSIVEKWSGADDDYYQPLYEMVNKYFGHLYRGYTYQKTGEVIPQFGGELFAPDELLESLKVNDEVLKNDLLILSKYDFNTDVDVNILGHIFEHSLNEVDDVEAELRGETLDKSKSKRKKDGVFYTPKYITKYIVDNTLGKLCYEKKIELKLDEDIAIFEYQKADGKLNEKGKELFERLNTYKSWLLTLKVCDPACGSGAFLNQALSFFIEEHKFVDDIIAELTNTPLRLFDTDLQILENNIFGVDINEESVEIAKLSMWLRTAQPGRKLSDLSNNIKCGNSLIDDPAVAGDKAFNWKKEFPTVFEKGGFDVVIGNPPYVRQELFKEFSHFLKDNFKSYSGKADLFIYFYEQSVRIVNDNGLVSFISSGKFFEANYGKPLIEFLVENTQLIEVIDFKDLNIFDGISAYPLILTFKNKKPATPYAFAYQDASKIVVESLSQITSRFSFEQIKSDDFIKNDFKFVDNSISKLVQKCNYNSVKLEDLKLLPLVGIKTGFNEGFLVSDTDKSKKYVFGRDIKRYGVLSSESEIFFPYNFINEKYELIDDLDVSLESIKPFKTDLEKRAIIKDGILDGSKKWYEFQQINKKICFDNEYIIYPNVSLGNNFTLSKNRVVDMTGFIIPTNSRYLLSILNSKLISFLMNLYAISRRGGYLEYKIQYVSKLPIKEIHSDSQNKFVLKAELMLLLNNNFNEFSQKFINYFSKKYKIEKLTGKLDRWYDLETSDFTLELSKAIKFAMGTPLTKKDEFEWMELFEENKKKALDLKTQIDQTDKELDYMVYELYGLTEEEIQIVENS